MTRRSWTSRLAPGLAATIALAGIVLAPPPPAAAAGDRLPDLQMAKLTDFRIVYSNGRRLLRFSSTIVNLGRGPLEIRANRASRNSPWNIDQVIFTTGGTRRVDTSAAMRYGGDGHGHWHVSRMVDVDLVVGAPRVGREDRLLLLRHEARQSVAAWRSVLAVLPRVHVRPEDRTDESDGNFRRLGR
jgi:hypothetical protein